MRRYRGCLETSQIRNAIMDTTILLLPYFMDFNNQTTRFVFISFNDHLLNASTRLLVFSRNSLFSFLLANPIRPLRASMFNG